MSEEARAELVSKLDSTGMHTARRDGVLVRRWSRTTRRFELFVRNVA